MQCHVFNFNTHNLNCSDLACETPLNCDNSCFLLWDTNGTRVSAGCGIGRGNDCNPTCVAGPPRNRRHYCCCTTSLCNYNYTIPEYTTLASNLSTNKPAQPIVSQDEPQTSLWWSLFPASFLIILIVLAISVYNRRRTKRNPSDNHDEAESHLNRPMMIPMMTGPQFHIQNTNLYHPNHQHRAPCEETDLDDIKIDLNNVELLEVLGRGRFGIVHRAFIKDEKEDSDTLKEVAVKVIKAEEHLSWQNERYVYKCGKMRHPNILNYFYSDEHVKSNDFWLIVEYAPRGSLCSYLKENVVKWEDFLNMALGIVRGLNQLHDASIAHRDFKSTNILLKQDLTPCITDFGVAKIFDSPNGSHIEERYHQVGTPRYMAPEVLECTIVFTKGSILKIDVYASSLVLWELLSRTSLPLRPVDASQQPDSSRPLLPQEEPSPSGQVYVPQPFMLPFEDVAGPKPGIERMRQIVVHEKQRPPLLPEWTSHPRLGDLCRLVLKEGWDSDFDSRISASCLLERVKFFVDREKSLSSNEQ